MTTISDPDRFGPRQTKDGTCFQLWAPGAREVTLLIDPQGPEKRTLPMVASEDGFFQREAECAVNERYLYSRDDGPALADPASRFQPQGVDGPSQLVDLEYAWTDQSWTGLPVEQLVIYELHIGTFTPQGTYEGIAERLDHLQHLGVTAIELMPVAAFPGRRNWGYDGVFHFAPFVGYGQPEELMRLVDKCHERGIAVILDLVTNHFGPQGNTMWTLAPAFFRMDTSTIWSAGLAWDLDPVMRYFDEVVRFWISVYHLDGIRFDAFNAVPERVRAKHLSRMIETLDRELGGRREVLFLLESADNQVSYLGQRRPGIHVAQLNFDFQRSMHALITGERHWEYRDYSAADEELGRCIAEGFAFRGRYSNRRHRVVGETTPLSDWDLVVNFIQNHDTVGNRYLGQRLGQLVADDNLLRAAAGLLLLHPAIPFLFMGQEWRATTPFFLFNDHPQALGDSVQQGRLKLFHESDPAGRKGQAPHCQEIEALNRSALRWEELKQPRHAQWLAFFRKLLATRRQIIPLISRHLADLSLQREGSLYTIQLASREPNSPPFVLIANLTQEPIPIPIGLDLIITTRPLDPDQLRGPCTALFRLADVLT